LLAAFSLSFAQDANAPPPVAVEPGEPNEPAPAPIPVTAKPQPWWHDAWAYRAELHFSNWEGDLGVGHVRLYGRAAGDARDLRVVDANGAPVNFIVVRHRPDYVTSLLVHVPIAGPQVCWLYYGNKDAPKIDTRRWNLRGGDWKARGGVLTRVWRKARPGHPKTLDELKQMIAAAGEPEGVTVLSNTFLGPNPFGESDHFLTHMEGWLKLDKAGKYTLRLFADDGAWLVVDGKEVIAWPGPRAESEWRSHFNPPNKEIVLDLQPGEHHVEIYHEEGEGMQMCSLGWSPPWPWSTRAGKALAFQGKEYFGVREIDEWFWGCRRVVRPGVHEKRGQALLCNPGLEMTFTYWVPDTEQQLTMATMRVASRSTAGKITQVRAEMDDGTVHVWKGDERWMRHVFFSNGAGRRSATFTVTDEKGNTDTQTVSTPTWQINVAHTAQVRLPKNVPQAEAYLDYMKDSPPYDVGKLLIDDLVGYALFWYTFDQDAKAASALGRLVKERPDHPALGDLATRCLGSTVRGGWNPELAMKLLGIIGGGNGLAARIRRDKDKLASLRAGERGIQDGRMAAYDLAGSIAESEEMLRELPLHKAHVLSWGKEDYKAAVEILNELIEKYGKSDVAAERAAARKATLAKADVCLLKTDYPEAEKILRELEKNDPRRMAQAERLTKIGGYPYTIDDFLGRDEPKLAIQAVDQWEDIAPLAKLKGQTFFYRGKAMYVDQPSMGAVKCLDLAERVNSGAVHAPEALWLKANCLMDIGEYERAIVEFARLRDEMASTEHLRKLPEKIEQCRKKLAEKAAASRPAK
jgi:tetratricopeptide (TPR) repeat protein